MYSSSSFSSGFNLLKRIENEIQEYKHDSEYTVYEFYISFQHTIYVLQRNQKSSNAREGDGETMLTTTKATSFKLVDKCGVYKSIHLSKSEFEYIIWKLMQMLDVNIHHPSTNQEFPEYSDVEVKELYPDSCCVFPHAYKIEAGTRQYILTDSDAFRLKCFHLTHKGILY